MVFLDLAAGIFRRNARSEGAAEFKTPWNFLAETNAEGRSPEVTSSANQIWWTVPDLNRSPLPCHGSALPDELTAQDFTSLVPKK